MNSGSMPILVIPAIPYEDGIRFLHRNDTIDIGSEMADDVWKILSFCSGYETVSSIVRALDLPEDEALGILNELEEMEIVIDSRYQLMHFHRISNYPTKINVKLTQDEIRDYTMSKRLPVKAGKAVGFTQDTSSTLHSLREKRRSCRNFSSRKIAVNDIGNICQYAYSIAEHSTPSGEALYPLKIYVLVESTQDDFSSGYYEYDTEQNQLILFNEDIDIEQLKYCFNQEDMPFGSSVQIIIAADFKRQAFKYANRGYRLTLIEAGHVAQNINLYCAEQGLGTCEMGGVLDEPLKWELDLPKDVWPLLAIPIGYPLKSELDEFDKIQFVERCVGVAHPVKDVWAQTFDEDGSFFGAAATYLDECGDIQYAGATSTSYADATFKAVIEGYERWRSSRMRVDFQGSASQVPGEWLDPREYFPLTEDQADKCNVEFFTEDLSINWTLGSKHDGSEIYIPSDLIYYGQKDDANRIYYGHSSGVAAHFDFNEAKKRAVIELIERDALMCNWFAQETPRNLASELLPTHVRKRCEYWEKLNRRMMILHIPTNFGMVFETIIVSDDYPCFVCGAAAAIDTGSIEGAILKSLQEAEYNLLLALRRPDFTPIDHERFYSLKENADKLHWLWEDTMPETYIFNEVEIDNLDRFYGETLGLITVDLSDAGSDIKVIRVFSRQLVPINFGFYSAHYKHPVIQYCVGVHPDSLEMPHYFA